ncbi:hypothetical protein BSKO_09842 [Bryopsis sp. KO-2023]|nr:hypothetical protein BSKO_09842 [Bryopsis sp. KO-2023]
MLGRHVLSGSRGPIAQLNPRASFPILQVPSCRFKTPEGALRASRRCSLRHGLPSSSLLHASSNVAGVLDPNQNDVQEVTRPGFNGVRAFLQRLWAIFQIGAVAAVASALPGLFARQAGLSLTHDRRPDVVDVRGTDQGLSSSSSCSVSARTLRFACASAASSPSTSPTVNVASPAAAAARVAARKAVPFSRKLKYRVQEILAKKLAGKLFTVLLVAIPVIGMGGLLYKLTSGSTWSQSLFKAYTVMSDIPGADACDEKNIPSTIVANLIFMSGLLTFAVILGIVCDDISSMVQDVRLGNYQVLEEGHTVVLNCNKQLGSVLRQMAIAKEERTVGTFKGPVIVLADVDKDELDAITDRALDGLKLDVKTRSGCTHDVSDLRKVAAEKAKTVIWLEPDDGDETSVSARRQTAIASLKTLGTGTLNSTHIVVQTQECTDDLPTGLPAVSLAVRCPPSHERTKLDIVEMYDAQNLERLLAQCALQPGLGKVMAQILEQSRDSCEIYLQGYDQLTGKKFSEARRFFDQAIPCGILRSDIHRMELNPSENYVIQPKDRVVLVAQSLKAARLTSKPAGEPSPWVKSVMKTPVHDKDTNILVLCFGTECDEFLAAMTEFSHESVCIHVVASCKPANLPKNAGACRVKFLEGNPSSYRMLSRVGLDSMDSVVLSGFGDMTAATADAQVISSLMQVQDLATKASREVPIHVVAPVNNPKSQEVAESLVSEGIRERMPCTMDLILPEEMSSGVLTQVAAVPRLDMVFKDLLDSQGVELYIRDPSLYSLIGRGSTVWRDVMDVVRGAGETAIGYIDKEGTVHTGPVASSTHAFEAGDKLVVLAED